MLVRRAVHAAILIACTFAGSIEASDLVIDLEDGETIRIPKKEAASRIRVDGLLQEPVWDTVPGYDEFRVIEPDTLAGVPHATIVRFVYGDEGLYIGVDLEQPPSSRIKRLSGRDARSINRDSINITLDTSGAGRYGYWFGVALGDSLMDGTVLPERQFTSDWDGAWRAATHETDTGWSAEFFIPWGTVAMPAVGEARRLGLYMSRKVAYLDERWGWPPLPSTVPKFMSVLQSLEVIGVNPKQQFSIFPFASASYDRIEHDAELRVGADVFWRPSTNFQLLGTLNPDFGNVESDEVVINLTATETFFPEKRLFFLEGQEVFFASPRADTRGTGVGTSSAPTTLINTRRIGGRPRPADLPPGATLSKRERVQPVDLLGAVKMTGQLGRMRYGVMAAAEDDVTLMARHNGQPLPIRQAGTDYAVVRVMHEASPGGTYRAFGFLGTAALHPEEDAVTFGLDGHYLSANGKIKLDSQVFTSDIDGVPQGYGGFIDMEYTIRQGVRQRVGLEYFDESVDLNDLGFLQRNDNLRLRASHIRTTSDLPFARDNQFDLRGYIQQNNDGLYTGGGLFFSDRIVLNDLSSMIARLNFTTEYYDDLNSFGNGAYRVEEKLSASFDWASSTTSIFSYGFGIGWGEEDVDGHFAAVGAKATWNPSDQLTVEARVNYRDRNGWLLHQEDRNFTAFDAEQWTPTLSLDYFLTAKQQLRASIQWVGVEAREKTFYLIPEEPGDLIPVDKPPGPSDSFGISQLSFQVRYRWEIAPLSDLFVVYTRTSDRGFPLRQRTFSDLFEQGWNDPLGDIFVVKVRYRFGS